MSVIVSKQSGNIGDASIWYRAEAYNVWDGSTTCLSTISKQYQNLTFANAGNSLGALLSITTNSQTLRPYTDYNGVYVQLQEVLGTCTMTIANPCVVTKSSHGFTGARSGVTIDIPTSVFTYTTHGLLEDMPVGFTTTGALPTGMSVGTIYYVKYLTADTFQIKSTPGGSAVTLSGTDSGTHSGWFEWVEFSTTGTLPTGINSNNATPYCVKYIDANTFNISTTAGGTSTNTTGSQSGTHSLWVFKRAKGKTGAEITNSTSNTRGTFIRGWDWDSGYAVTTAASTWRLGIVYAPQGGSYYFSLRTSNTTAPFYVAWCDTAVTYSDTNDFIICRKDAGHVITINQNIQPKPYLGTGAASYAYHAIITASNDRTIGSDAGLVWENPPASSYTYTMDGYCRISTHGAFRAGTSASPIPYAQKAVFTCKYTPTAGATVRASGFCDGTSPTSGVYYFDGANFYLYGEVPTVKWCRLVSDAAASQKDLVCDDATGFTAGEVLFIGRENATTYSSTSIQSNNTIASIAGNTITMTDNLTGQTRYGRTSVGTATMTIADPCVVTIASHGLYDNEEVCFTTTGALPTGLTENTGYYYVKKIDADTFKLRSTRGSTTYLATSGTQSGTHTCYRAGAHVVRFDGYGIDFFSDSTTATQNVYPSFHGPINYQVSGVRFRNVFFYLYSSAAYCIPYCETAYMEQWLVQDCFWLGYERTTNCGIYNFAAPMVNGFLFNRNIGMFCYAFTNYGVNNSLSLGSVLGNKSIKSGVFTATNNYFSKTNSAFFLDACSTAVSYGTMTNNYFDNCYYTVRLTGNKSTTVKYNYSWGAYCGTYVHNCYDIPKINNTENVYDKAYYCIYLGYTTMIGCGETENIYNPTTAGAGSDFNLAAGGYYLGDSGYTVENPSKELVTLHSDFLTYLIDTTSPSKLRISNNALTTNRNLVIAPEGFWRSAGDGLTDTTVHTSGTGKYSIRADPLSTAYERLSWSQTIPTGDIQNKDAAIGVWVKIYSANFYAGSHELPRLTVEYDNGASTAYAQAAQSINWQYLSIPFTPATTYGQIKVTFSAKTDATFAPTETPGDSSVYFDDFTMFYPAGVQLDLGGLDLWANALPVTPCIATNVSAFDVWAVSPSTFGTGTVGALIKKIYKLISFILVK